MRKCVFSETDSCLNDSKLFFERENEKKRKEEKGKIGRKKRKRRNGFVSPFTRFPLFFVSFRVRQCES